ncbi:MAG: cell envelope integrity protein TolA [Gammaproteobacteria bacterium]|jgi:colicin import membrane protein|nr:cell envelope integrity protein TolA [Gammaproteobacteria bacterium]
MAAALLNPAAPARGPLLISVAAHVLLLLFLSTNFVMMPRQAPVPLAIQAVVVNPEQLVDSEAAAAAARQAAAEQRRREQQAEQARREAEQRQQAEQAAAERRRQEAERAATAAAEEQRQAAQRAAEQREAERKAAEAKAAREAQAKQAAAAQAKAEAERQRREAEAARERERQAAAARARAEAEAAEQARRQAELLAAIEAEEALAAAQNSGALNEYVSLIQQQVQQRWVQPASAVVGIECTVSVRQLPSGEVVEARVTRCNGDETVRRSVENAVYAASPLPLPRDRLLFDRNLTFTFKPEVD